jgi:hypothetical protein
MTPHNHKWEIYTIAPSGARMLVRIVTGELALQKAIRKIRAWPNVEYVRAIRISS